jgi:hypothetical protein
VAHHGRRNADEVLAAALAAGQTLRDAAVTAGLSERTANRRWAEVDFRRRVAELRAAAAERAVGKMADSLSQAADVLRKLLGAEHESIRLGAARSILEVGLKLRQAFELEERLVALEKHFGGKGVRTEWHCQL